MNVIEAIRKRRMDREFTNDPIDEEILDQLAWAATRAPMGGAELVRSIIVVSDPALVRVVRQVTPSFTGHPHAFIVICTDLERAEAVMGKLGRDILSLIDAGAAAENIALAAIELQVGVCFVRSANDVALQEVLDLPAEVRPELIIAVGRPAPARSRKPRMQNPVVFRDRFGQTWQKAVNGA